MLQPPDLFLPAHTIMHLGTARETFEIIFDTLLLGISKIFKMTDKKRWLTTNSFKILNKKIVRPAKLNSEL